MKKYQNFYLKIFIFFCWEKFSIYLNRRVFVMLWKNKNIRIYHGCEGYIEKSVPRVTAWYHEACRVVSDCEIYYLSLTSMIDFFSCILFISESGCLIMRSLRL